MAPSLPGHELAQRPTTREDWTRSDLYHNSFLISRDEALEFALKNSDEKGLPQIAVSAAQGKFLYLLAKSLGAKRILEVGTLGGFSTIWLAQALPADGNIITCELDKKHADTAQENLTYAGLESKVKILVGPAAESLRNLHPDQPFDFVFIDADKPGNKTYFIEAKRLVRKGGVIIVDNVVRNGLVSDPSHTDAPCEGVRELLTYMKDDKEVEATTMATVGEKGYDGFLYAIKL